MNIILRDMNQDRKDIYKLNNKIERDVLEKVNIESQIKYKMGLK